MKDDLNSGFILFRDRRGHPRGPQAQERWESVRTERGAASTLERLDVGLLLLVLVTGGFVGAGICLSVLGAW